jgi:putative ABC transport system permease protein
VIRSLDGLALRQLRTRRLRALLTTFGIVLGVGMVFGVLLLVGTIRGTFGDLINSAWGETDVVVMGAAGGVLPDDAVERAKAVEGVQSAAGMVGAQFVRLDRRGRAVGGTAGRMWVAGYEAEGYQPYDFREVAGRRFREGDEIVLDQAWAQDKGFEVGDRLDVMTPTGRHRLRVVGIFKLGAEGMSFGGQALSGMPLERAREIMDLPTGWYQVSVAATDRSNATALEGALTREFGPGADVKTPGGFREDIEEELGALNVVLYFFSGIALFVGVFLILNAFNMTVLQRIREIGTLRTLGAERSTIVRTVLTEALALGVVGSIVGLAVGLGLAALLLAAMRGMGMPVGGVAIAAGPALIAFGCGLVATAAGAAWPAVRAGRISPIRAVLGQTGTRRKPRARRLVIGLVLFLPGVILGGGFWFGDPAGRSGLESVLAVVLTMAMFGGMAVAAPFLITPIVGLLAAPLRRLFPTAGRLAADASRTNPGRTAATAVALTIGLSVVMVNAVMSTSFVDSLDRQMTASLARDLTVRPAGTTLQENAQAVPTSVRRRIAAMPDAGVVTPIRVLPMQLPTSDGGEVQGMAQSFDPEVYGAVDRSPVTGARSREDALRGVAAGGVIVSTGYAKSADIAVGDRMPLDGPRGRRMAPVVGILESTAEFGGMEVVQMSLDTMRRVYGTTTDSQLAVAARGPDRREALQRQVDALLAAEYPSLEAASTAEVRGTIEKQIDAQFGMFNAIVGIAIIVSLLGVVNTLAMSVMERTREIGVLRALGSSRWLVRWTMVDESVLMTMAGAISGLALGSVIGLVWIADATLPGMQFVFPVFTAVLVTVLAVLLGAIAAIIPARRAARLDPVKALSYE